jgi:hypothetical protein
MKKMLTQEIVRHGENTFVPVEQLPDNATLVEESEQSIVGHSETGHHHVMHAPHPAVVSGALKNIRRYEAEGVTYVEVPDGAVLRHLKQIEPHEPIEFRAGLYKRIDHKAYDYAQKVMRRTLD